MFSLNGFALNGLRRKQKGFHESWHASLAHKMHHMYREVRATARVGGDRSARLTLT